MRKAQKLNLELAWNQMGRRAQAFIRLVEGEPVVTVTVRQYKGIRDGKIVSETSINTISAEDMTALEQKLAEYNAATAVERMDEQSYPIYEQLNLMACALARKYVRKP